jgi:hypothetical protein
MKNSENLISNLEHCIMVIMGIRSLIFTMIMLDIYTCRLLEMARIPCLHVIVVCVGRRWALEKYALHQYSKEIFPNP